MKTRIFLTLFAFIFTSSLYSANANPELLSLFKPAIRGAQSDESVYFVMTDRFENGDLQNDNAGLTEGRFSSGYVPEEIGWWHGGDFKGIENRIPYIKKMGFTSIWITPPVKQIVFQGSSSSYHGYWGLDFLTVDSHLGTEADFISLVSSAHDAGLKVIVDVVANHTADVIQYKNNATEYLESFRFPYKDAKGKAFISSKYAGKASFPALSSAKSFPYKPVLDKSNLKIKNPTWLNDVTNYHNRGNSTFTGESALDGDFFGLDDLFTEKPNVVKGWTDIWSYWITKFDIDGLRIDTFKHVNPEFWQAVIPKILEVAKKQGKTDFPIFGEVADSDPLFLSGFLRGKQTPSVLDFGFQRQVSNYVKYGSSVESLINLFNADDLYTSPTTNAYQLATFLGNHDMGRIGLQLSKAVGEEQRQALLDRAKLANGLLLLLRGGPVIYYGDEVGMIGTGGDKEARQDMFSTQVPEWQTEPRIGASPIGKASSFDSSHPLRDQITQLQQLIKDNPALRVGVQEIKYAQKGIFIVTRFSQGQEYVVAFNSRDEAGTASINPNTANSAWLQLDGKCLVSETLTIDIPARSYCVLKAEKQYSPKSVGSISLKKPSETPTTGELIELSATSPSMDYLQVTFSARVKAGQWRYLGTSDRKTFQDERTKGDQYRIYLDPHLYKSGSQIEIVAVASSTDGTKVASAVVNYKVKY